jgi:hypothetical protein
MLVLVEHRVRLIARMRVVEVERSPWWHLGEYFPNAYDCSVARGRTLDALFRDLERCDENIASVDAEIAMSGFDAWIPEVNHAA